MKNVFSQRALSLKIVIFAVQSSLFLRKIKPKQTNQSKLWSFKETHFPASIYLLLKARKKTVEQDMKFTQCQQQKYKNKFNKICMLSKSQTPGTPHTPSISILASIKHSLLGYYKIVYGPKFLWSKNRKYQLY